MQFLYSELSFQGHNTLCRMVCGLKAEAST